MRFVIIFVGPNPSIFLAPPVSAAKVKTHADWGGWRFDDMDMRDRISEQSELAHMYAEDGAYQSAARILSRLAEEVQLHADSLDSMFSKNTDADA